MNTKTGIGATWRKMGIAISALCITTGALAQTQEMSPASDMAVKTPCTFDEKGAAVLPPAIDAPELKAVSLVGVNPSADNVPQLTWCSVAKAKHYFIYAKRQQADAAWKGVCVANPRDASNGMLQADFILEDGTHTGYTIFTMRALVK